MENALRSVQQVEVLYIADLPKWQHEKPFFLSDSQRNDTQTITNFVGDIRSVPLTDLRYNCMSPTLEEDGFTVMRHRSRIDLHQSRQDSLGYIRETIDLLKDVFDDSTVLCYDIRRRSDMQDRGQLKPIIENSHKMNEFPAPPVNRVHADHTLSGGFHRARRHLTDAELENYVASGKWRMRIINTWRPITQIKSSPLAFLDRHTLKLSDLVETDSVNSQYVGENYCVKFDPQHRFFWLSDQRPDELYIFIAFDSSNVRGTNQQINTCPHTALNLSQSPDSSDIRESIETRSFVFTPA